MADNKKKSKTGYKGIYFNPNANVTNPYVATLVFYSGKNDKRMQTHIGYFPTAELAHIARINFIDNLK